MLFDSFAFAVFFPVMLLFYWISPLRRQNILLLIGSYFFYGYWDWRFLSLIAISTIVDYSAALFIGEARRQKDSKKHDNSRIWLIISICTNLGILGFFKYFNFFIDTFSDLVVRLGANPDSLYLNIILPVGISFYTFQTMSYTIDVYRGVMKPTKDLLGFAARPISVQTTPTRESTHLLPGKTMWPAVIIARSPGG